MFKVLGSRISKSSDKSKILFYTPKRDSPLYGKFISIEDILQNRSRPHLQIKESSSPAVVIKSHTPKKVNIVIKDKKKSSTKLSSNKKKLLKKIIAKSKPVIKKVVSKLSPKNQKRIKKILKKLTPKSIAISTPLRISPKSTNLISRVIGGITKKVTPKTKENIKKLIKSTQKLVSTPSTIKVKKIVKKLKDAVRKI